MVMRAYITVELHTDVIRCPDGQETPYRTVARLEGAMLDAAMTIMEYERSTRSMLMLTKHESVDIRVGPRQPFDDEVEVVSDLAGLLSALRKRVTDSAADSTVTFGRIVLAHEVGSAAWAVTSS
jgi:hypothetical protein